jgi:hypothetical protein
MADEVESRAIGISLKDRAPILPASDMANGAYWRDARSGNLVSGASSLLPAPLRRRAAGPRWKTSIIPAWLANIGAAWLSMAMPTLGPPLCRDWERRRMPRLRPVPLPKRRSSAWPRYGSAPYRESRLAIRSYLSKRAYYAPVRLSIALRTEGATGPCAAASSLPVESTRRIGRR